MPSVREMASIADGVQRRRNELDTEIQREALRLEASELRRRQVMRLRDVVGTFIDERIDGDDSRIDTEGQEPTIWIEGLQLGVETVTGCDGGTYVEEFVVRVYWPCRDCGRMNRRRAYTLADLSQYFDKLDHPDLTMHWSSGQPICCEKCGHIL